MWWYKCIPAGNKDRQCMETMALTMCETYRTFRWRSIKSSKYAENMLICGGVANKYAASGVHHQMLDTVH